MTPAPMQYEPHAREWARQQFGESATVHDFGPMPGNAGLSFGFDVRDADGTPIESVVVRLAPPGVRRSGNTDVLRQVPLLTALAQTDVPVAPLLWSGDESCVFGTDAIAQRKLTGTSLTQLLQHDALAPGRTIDDYIERTVEALARVHEVDWERLLKGWAEPVGVEDDLAYWFRLADKAADPEVLELATRLRDELIRRQLSGDRIGLFHGDYQTSNLLYDERGDVQAIVDWEIAGIGRTGMDVGWFAFMTDPTFWGPERRADMNVWAEPGVVRAWYEQYSGVALPDFDWYQAYGSYRFGTIAAYNVRLHRTGKRPDEVWERMASSVRILFERPLELLGA